jgi:glycosyltransferase involved in cell wall biosynthesis
MLEHPRIAVVSPFLDKKHGTERRVTELVNRLARDYGYEVHIYSQRVEDIPNVRDYERGDTSYSDKSSGAIWWHHVPKIVGPGLLQYIWWFVVNQLLRWWDKRVHHIQYDMVYTPGINCFDADAISVHIVFAEFYRQVKDDLVFHQNPIHFWPWLIHRQIYYRVIIALERLIYTRRDIKIVAIARKVAADLQRFYGQATQLPIVYLGVDSQQFNPQICASLRSNARHSLGLTDETFVLLLIGSDWKKKGVSCLLQSVGQLRNINVSVLIAGRDQQAPYQKLINQYGLQERVQFLPPRPDIQFYYAAADAYVAPSREDAFAQPPAEAMACGLPVIASSHDGASEMITHGVDGLILKDPTDYQELSRLIKQLYENVALRQSLQENAIRTTQQYTWSRNAAKMQIIFQEVMLHKGKGTVRV